MQHSPPTAPLRACRPSLTPSALPGVRCRGGRPCRSIANKEDIIFRQSGCGPGGFRGAIAEYRDTLVPPKIRPVLPCPPKKMWADRRGTASIPGGSLPRGYTGKRIRIYPKREDRASQPPTRKAQPCPTKPPSRSTAPRPAYSTRSAGSMSSTHKTQPMAASLSSGRKRGTRPNSP